MSTVAPPHRNSEAMIDPCDNDDSKLSGYRCVVLPFSSSPVGHIKAAVQAEPSRIKQTVGLLVIVTAHVQAVC